MCLGNQQKKKILYIQIQNLPTKAVQVGFLHKTAKSLQDTSSPYTDKPHQITFMNSLYIYFV